MTESVPGSIVLAAVERMAVDLVAHAEELRELDAAIGDGDLGITITIGCGALREAIATLDAGDIGAALSKAGMAFNRKAASTFGALVATMGMRAGREAKGRADLSLADLAAMCRAAAEGVKERGKSDVGQKTLLDALVPAAAALETAAAEGASIAEALGRAARAAEAGARATEEMKSQVGRASWFTDRTAGVRDPGAQAIALAFASLAAYASGE
ncbi:MAG: DAK2 domain-containing protein [Chloroflexi bacterium]|nr:DAK2 domain-containing protein [Chloroflexota bacterium]